MDTSLSSAEVRQYRDDGFLFPLDVFSGKEVKSMHAAMEGAWRDAARAGLGEQFPDFLRTRAHMTLPFVADLAAHPGLLDRVAAILGPDLLLWGADFFINTWLWVCPKRNQ